MTELIGTFVSVDHESDARQQKGNGPVAATLNRRAGRPGSVAMRGQRISKVFEQDKGLRRFTGNSAPGRAESSATLKLSYSAVLVRRWPLLALMLCTPTAWATESSDRRFNVARDRTASLGSSGIAPRACRPPGSSCAQRP